MIDYEQFKKEASKKKVTITEEKFVDVAAQIIGKKLTATRRLDIAIIQSDIIAQVASAIFEEKENKQE